MATSVASRLSINLRSSVERPATLSAFAKTILDLEVQLLLSPLLLLDELGAALCADDDDDPALSVGLTMELK